MKDSQVTFQEEEKAKSGYKGKGKKGKKKEQIEEYDVENYQDVKEFIEFMKEYEKDIYALNPTVNGRVSRS